MAFESNTGSMRNVGIQLTKLRETLKGTMDDLKTYVDDTFNNRCEGYLADLFRNQVYYPSDKELNEQLNKLEEVGIFVGSTAPDTIDEGVDEAASRLKF